MQGKSSVAAAETPPRDQPIASEIGCRNTASDSIAPMPTQVISAPAPTTIQPYSKPEGLFMRFLARFGVFGWRSRNGDLSAAADQDGGKFVIPGHAQREPGISRCHLWIPPMCNCTSGVCASRIPE